jgi:signal peptidase I
MPQDTTRKPLFAFIASLVMPGLGQLYNGELIKGLLLFLALCIATPLAAWLALHAPKHHILLVLVLILILILAMYIYAMLNAYRSAKRISNSYTLKPFNKIYVYAIAFIVGYVFIFGGLLHYTRNHLMASFYIPSQSMLPTLLPGDYVIADKRSNCAGCKNHLRHGDLAIFVNPNDHNKLYIKRVVGLPDDDVAIKGTDIRVNDVPIRTEQVTEFGHAELNQLLATHIGWREKSGRAVYKVIWHKDMQQENASFTVPEGKVFVLGDNRNAAQDSRRFGTVPLADVVAVAKQVWFSSSRQSGTRWWRVGIVVDPYY